MPELAGCSEVTLSSGYPEQIDDVTPRPKNDSSINSWQGEEPLQFP